MQEQHLAAERLLQVSSQQLAHLGELREHQSAVAGRDDFLQHLRQTRQFARATGNCGVVAEELRGMIAHLLELRQRRQNHALAAGCLRLVEARDRLFDDGCVQRRLLLGQRAKDLHLHLFGQVGDDALVGLQPAQDERAGQSSSTARPLPGRGRLNRHEEVALELGLRAEKPGIEKLHDRPQIADVVLDRRAGQRDAIVRRQARARPWPAWFRDS